jgi:hypothetical protein
MMNRPGMVVAVPRPSTIPVPLVPVPRPLLDPLGARHVAALSASFAVYRHRMVCC